MLHFQRNQARIIVVYVSQSVSQVYCTTFAKNDMKDVGFMASISSEGGEGGRVEMSVRKGKGCQKKGRE